MSLLIVNNETHCPDILELNTGFERNMTTENDTGGINKIGFGIFFNVLSSKVIHYEIKLFSVHP